MNPDIINGAFEIFGALSVLLNITKILKDKEIKGVSSIPCMFFTLWGIWNLYYYPHLEQLWSFIGAVIFVINNSIYILLMIYFKDIKGNKNDEKEVKNIAG